MSDSILSEVISSLSYEVIVPSVSDDTGSVWLDTGHSSLNSVLGNEEYGIPSGRIIELFGTESSGKSALSYYLMGCAQRSGGVAVLVDTEAVFDSEWVSRFADPDSIIQIPVGFSTDKNGKRKTYGLEDVFSRFEEMVDVLRSKVAGKPCLLVVDTIAGAPVRSDLEGGDYSRDGVAIQARIMSSCLRRFVHVLKGSNSILLCVNQVRDVIGMMSYSTTPGGKALKFYASVRVRMKKKRERTASIQCSAVNVKNKISRPFRSAVFDISFSKGIVFE